ncbi:MAG: high frequency lysogenization protein HflD [Gammaproteobacteria bacterium]|nr:high frequency lysogenization protein HflD [Gammaproteobacteria bacterium]
MAHQQERVLALAGIFQAGGLAQQLARDGRAEADAFHASIHSLLLIDAASAAEVYGGVRGVALGLKLLSEKLVGVSSPKDLEMAKYAMATIQLEAALRRRPEVAAAIRAGIGTIESQMAFFDTDDNAIHPRLLDKLAELYTQTLSTVTPRVMVSGEQGYLANPHIAARVRAALFAGVRSAVLWRQYGGRRWQLLLSRTKIAAEAGRLLKTT